MLLVDDHQAQRSHRREHRRAGADDNVHVTAADALPLIVAFAVGESAVLDGDALAKGGAEERRNRGGQRDLRHEEEYTAAAAVHDLGKP